MDIKFINVLILGFGFMFLFTSFQTMGIIEKTVLESIQQDDKNFTGEGYTSLAIIYAVFAIFNWLAPSILSFIGPRGAMFVGSLIYTGFVVTFLWPMNWLLYLASAVLGIGASITWTGQGNFLSRCSDPTTISRNSGIFWAMLQTSMFFGNLFVYFQFQDKDHIDKETRTIVFSVLTAVAVLGVVFLASLRPVSDIRPVTETNLEEPPTGMASAVFAFKEAVRLFFTRDMLLLSITFFYTGLELSFYSGVYGASIGFTKQMGDIAKPTVGMAGVCIGVGEVLGGLLFGILGSRTSRFGRDPIVMAGFVVQLAAFALIFVNIPDAANFGPTDDHAILEPPLPWLALFCAFLLGFGDASFNTQIYSMLGGVFARQSVGAFALFKFTQSVAAAASFFYSPYVGLRAQLGILVGFGTIGTICFVFVERVARKREKTESTTTKISESSVE